MWPWNLTDDLEKNRAPLPCYFKLSASFRSHCWIQTGDKVWKCPIWVKFDDFFSRVTLKFDRWPWKTIGTSSKHHQALCIISLPYVNSNLCYGPEPAKWGHDLWDLDLWPLTLTFLQHPPPPPPRSRHRATEIWLNTGLGNGLLPDSIKPLPEPMLSDHQ